VAGQRSRHFRLVRRSRAVLNAASLEKKWPDREAGTFRLVRRSRAVLNAAPRRRSGRTEKQEASVECGGQEGY
jgi:hypothetical protein